MSGKILKFPRVPKNVVFLPDYFDFRPRDRVFNSLAQLSAQILKEWLASGVISPREYVLDWSCYAEADAFIAQLPTFSDRLNQITTRAEQYYALNWSLSGLDKQRVTLNFMLLE